MRKQFTIFLACIAMGAMLVACNSSKSESDSKPQTEAEGSQDQSENLEQEEEGSDENASEDTSSDTTNDASKDNISSDDTLKDDASDDASKDASEGTSSDNTSDDTSKDSSDDVTETAPAKPDKAPAKPDKAPAKPDKAPAKPDQAPAKPSTPESNTTSKPAAPAPSKPTPTPPASEAPSTPEVTPPSTTPTPTPDAPKEESSTTASCSEIFSQITSGIELGSQMEMGSDMLLDFYNIDTNLLEDYCVKMPQLSFQITEIGVFKVKDANTIDTVVAGITQRANNIGSCLYPSLQETFDSRVVVTQGNYILFAISEDAAKIADSFKNLVK